MSRKFDSNSDPRKRPEGEAMRWQPAQSKAGVTRRGGPRDPFDAGFEEPEIVEARPSPPPAEIKEAPTPLPAPPAASTAQVAPAKPAKPSARSQSGRRGGHGNWLDDEIQAIAPGRSGDDNLTPEPRRRQQVTTIIIACIAIAIIIRVLVAIFRMAF